MTIEQMTDRSPVNSSRVIFINRFFYPDYSATAQILSDVAFGLTRRGLSVSVISSRLLYEDPQAKLRRRETIEGVDVIRIQTTRFGRSGLAGRAIDYMTFYISCLFALIKHVRRGDVVVFKTDPPLLSVPLGVAARMRGAVIVNWLQDIFPETAQALGMKMAGSLLGSILKQLRNRSLQKAAITVVIGKRMAEYVAACGVAQERIVEIPNFCDDNAIQPRNFLKNPLRAAWGLTHQDFVLGYSGNLGRAHDLRTILGAAEALKAYTDIKFLFIGGGQLRQTLEVEVRARGLASVILQPYQPREQLELSLCVPDVHWVSLRPQLEGFILPSKLYGIAAAGRPVLMIGDPQGEIGRIVSEHGMGTVVPIGAAETLASRILSWKRTPGLIDGMGQRARSYIDNSASRALAIDRWFKLVRNLMPAA